MCSKWSSGCATAWPSSTKASWCWRTPWPVCAAPPRPWKTRLSAPSESSGPSTPWIGYDTRGDGRWTSVRAWLQPRSPPPMKPARAILWAQWRTFRNYPSLGTSWALAVGALWYGAWLAAAFATARVLANPEELGLIRLTLPGGLVLVFLYWQVAPLLVAATGASLDLRKLQAYPIPTRQLFGIEVLLRTTAAIEMLLVLLGAAIGISLNPQLPKLGVVAI